MKLKQTIVMFAALALALPLAAQMGMGPRTPSLSGIWHPVVGTGAAYEVTNRDGTKSQIEITTVGKEDVGGKPAFWTEMGFSDRRTGGQMYAKNLMSVSDTGVTSTRMIMQMPGQAPMEMDANMAPGGRGQQTTPANIADKAEIVGTESVTVPAGTFSCTHYHMKDGSGDAWVSDKVAPWGLVKSVGKDNSMVLTKVITDATDHITGTPVKFDPMQMMRGRQGQPPQ